MSGGTEFIMAEKINIKRNVTKKDILITLGIIIGLIIIFFAADQLIAALQPEPPTEAERVRQRLSALAEENSRFGTILENFDEYPVEMFRHSLISTRYIEYLYNYPEHKNDYLDYSYTESERNEEVPFLFQFDSRWCYEDIGGATIYTEGCIPTSLTMAYIGLTGNYDLDPPMIAGELTENGFKGLAGFTVHGIPDFFKRHGIPCVQYDFPLVEGGEIHDEEIFTDALNEGKLIVGGMGKGDFADSGHCIIIREYRDGFYYVNNPNNPDDCVKGWEYETFASQAYYLWIAG